jgi:hypothetical protein
MSNLILKNNLLKSNSRDPVRAVARIDTLTVLHRLNGERKGAVVRFLYEAGLIDRESRVSLKDADLEGVSLKDTDLTNANLEGSDLKDAHFEGATLEGADLARSDLRSAHLENAHVKQADFGYSNVENADLPNLGDQGAYVRHIKNRDKASERCPAKPNPSNPGERMCLSELDEMQVQSSK